MWRKELNKEKMTSPYEPQKTPVQELRLIHSRTIPGVPTTGIPTYALRKAYEPAKLGGQR